MTFVKVDTFWEGHKILQNLHLTFDWQDKSEVKISQNFVAFLEYMNFEYLCKSNGEFVKLLFLENRNLKVEIKDQRKYHRVQKSDFLLLQI